MEKDEPIWAIRSHMQSSEVSINTGIFSKLEKPILNAYTIFLSLDNKDKEIVNKIATQIPLSCETVAKIYKQCSNDIIKTAEYIFWVYGYVIK